MSINWITHDHYEEAIALSAASNKPILIYFHSRGCSGCERLANEVLGTDAVQHAISKSVIPVWVEVEGDRANKKISALVGSHIFIMSPVVQIISSTGDIFHKFLGVPLHTRLDLGYASVHHDVSGSINESQFLNQLELGLGKRNLFCGDLAQAEQQFTALSSQNLDPISAEEVDYWMPVAQRGGQYQEDCEPQADLPALSAVANEVRRFCSLLCMIPDEELMKDWPGTPGQSSWAHYTDCLREVCLGAYQALLDVANHTTHRRAVKGQSMSQAQLILSEWQKSYRALQGTLCGLGMQEWDRQHLHENYTLGKQRTIRNNIVHCVMAEFWAHGSAIQASRSAYAGAPNDGSQPVLATWKRFGPPPANFGSRAELLNTWEQRHQDLVEEFSSIADEELDFEHRWWEGTSVSIRFRLNRLGWHLQDHAAVIETICERLGRVRSETERLAVRIYAALGSAEGTMIGLSAGEKNLLFAEATALLRGKSDELVTCYGLTGQSHRVIEPACSQPVAEV